MGISRALFSVGGGEWGIILAGWGWVGHYFGWVRVGGDERGWVGVGAMLVVYGCCL